METKEAYQKKLEAQLKVWNAQITLLAAKAENAGADVRIKYAEELESIRKKQKEADKKIQELGAASNETWGTVKVTADKLWDDLKAGIGEAMSKFK